MYRLLSRGEQSVACSGPSGTTSASSRRCAKRAGRWARCARRCGRAVCSIRRAAQMTEWRSGRRHRGLDGILGRHPALARPSRTPQRRCGRHDRGNEGRPHLQEGVKYGRPQGAWSRLRNSLVDCRYRWRPPIGIFSSAVRQWSCMAKHGGPRGRIQNLGGAIPVAQGGELQPQHRRLDHVGANSLQMLDGAWVGCIAVVGGRLLLGRPKSGEGAEFECFHTLFAYPRSAVVAWPGKLLDLGLGRMGVLHGAEVREPVLLGGCSLEGFKAATFQRRSWRKVTTLPPAQANHVSVLPVLDPPLARPAHHGAQSIVEHATLRHCEVRRLGRCRH